MESKKHWEKIYKAKVATEVSWFQEHATLSLRFIRNATTSNSFSIIDLGGGASTLVDDLLAHSYENITVLDLSGAALATAKARLGALASKVQWVEANILEYEFPVDTYDIWHDRAVFHFFTAAEDRQTYIQKMLRAVKPGGLVIVATFAEDGPDKCSGLPVMRYSADELYAEFGNYLELLDHEKEIHNTPGGNEQKFNYCCCRKVATF